MDFLHFKPKHMIPGIVLVMLTGCASYEQNSQKESPKTIDEPAATQHYQCAGEVGAPPIFVPLLTEVDDPSLVSDSIKGPTEGYLCQAKAYKVNKSFEIFRAWNSNNPGSEKGKWWSFKMPSGRVSEFREDFAVCPRWSPLDMMTRCTLKEGAHLVLGTGQSAFCNKYLTYPPSPEIQIYLADAGESVLECKTYFGVFNWQEVPVVEKAPDENESQDNAMD